MPNGFQIPSREALAKAAGRLPSLARTALVSWARETAEGITATWPILAGAVGCAIFYALFPVFSAYALVAGTALCLVFVSGLIIEAMFKDAEVAVGVLFLTTAVLVIVTCVAVLAFLFCPSLFGR